jgi:phosphate transport system substrate-binding protein
MWMSVAALPQQVANVTAGSLPFCDTASVQIRKIQGFGVLSQDCNIAVIFFAAFVTQETFMERKTRTSFLMAAGLAAILGFSAAASAADITGAGATFPYPIYAKWAEAYKAKTGIGMNYQSIGSGGGIKQIKAKTVDFGASDMPLKPEALEKDGLMQFPTVMGGVVPVVNLAGIAPGQIKLTGPVLADIFLGKIKKWNEPAIADLNKGVALPDQAITVVHRSDGSGTTFIFTNYLSKVSPEWKQKVGEETSVSWPTGVGGKGNEGVASYVKQIKGAIGYVEYAYALQNKMAHTLLQNKEGTFVAPGEESFKAAAAGANWEKAPGFYEILTDEPGKQSWPITGATFILMHKSQANTDGAKAVLSFFDWAYANGDKLALDLDYIPMPDNVVKLVQGAWKAQIKDASGKTVW